MKHKARFLRHEPCDRCSSSDARAVYEDGSKHCFSCGEHWFGDGLHKLRDTGEPERPQILAAVLTRTLRPDAEAWLDKYGLTADEKLLFKWDEKYERLAYIEQDFYNGRRFGPDGPKYKSFGNKPWSIRPTRHYGSTGTLVYVEDAVSAIKVSRVADVMCLHGSHLPLEKVPVSLGYDRHVVWLDPDKFTEAIKIANQLRSLGLRSETVVSVMDPKDFDTDDIEEFLTTPTGIFIHSRKGKVTA